MRSVPLRIRLLAGLLTFAAGVLIVAGWLAHRPADVTQLEDPDCFRTEPDITSVRCAPPDAPLNFCEVIREPERYRKKIIRVRAGFTGYHLPALYGPDCSEPRLFALVEFDSGDVRKRLMDEIARINPASTSGDIRAEVFFVGRFEVNSPPARTRLGYFGGEEMKGRLLAGEDIFSFTVIDVERVGAAAPEPAFSPR